MKESDVVVRKISTGYGDLPNLQATLRQLLLDGGLGGTDENAPLKDIIDPGMTVLVKPNWVLHENFSDKGMDCLVTHPKFILAVLAEVFKAQPGRVIIGDAPVQGCDFDRLVTEAWAAEVAAIATCPFDIVDFRRTVLRKGGLSEGQDTERRGEERYVLFDLGKESLLEPVSDPENRFRITCYHPDHLADKHRPGRHQYLLCKEVFEADVVINLPKLKTHKKAGMTAALKNLVGLNGNKEYLPHHRIGSQSEGGDCYQRFAPLKKVAEYCLDEANRNIGSKVRSRWMMGYSRIMQIHGKFGNPEIEGGWFGNDTVWRMSLDLNRIALYGGLDGRMSDSPLRKIYTIADGIVGGQGEGPLAPEPVELGICTFACSSAFADLVHCALMGLDYRKIPLVREAFGSFRYPLVGDKPEHARMISGRNSYSPTDAAAEFGRKFVPAKGWRGHIEL